MFRLMGIGLIVLIGLTVPIGLLRAAPDAGVVGDGTPVSCTEAALTSALAGGGTVTFNCGGPKTILVLTVKTIATGTTIDGGDVITLTGGLFTRLFDVNPSATLTLKNIVLDSAFSTGSDGGAISNHGTLNLDHVTIQSSQTDISHSGGAIFTDGPATITDSIFRNNSGGSAGAIFANFEKAHVTITRSLFRNNQTVVDSIGGYGGAIWLGQAAQLSVSDSQFLTNTARHGGGLYSTGASTLTVTNTTFINNSAQYGGGLDNFGTITLTNSTFSRNSARVGTISAGYGGGFFNGNVGTAMLISVTLNGNSADKDGGSLYNQNGGKVTLTNSVLSGNSAQGDGGGIFNSGTMTLTNATLSGNSGGEGGGISTFGGALTLNKVTLSDNSAIYGAGIHIDLGTHTLTNVTLSNNSAQSNGGGIYNSRSALTLVNVTFADNTGGISSTGGIVNGGVGPDPHLNMKNVLFAVGKASANCTFAVPPDSSNFNLSDDNSCGFGASRDGVNLRLGPLADNGGSTQTHLPLTGSPAIDSGTNAGCPTTDQRGKSRPVNDTCDVGAVERQGVVYLPLILR